MARVAGGGRMNNCTWKWKWLDLYVDGFWGTSCKNAFYFDDGGPREHEFNYCPYCGKLLKVAELPEEVEE